MEEEEEGWPMFPLCFRSDLRMTQESQNLATG